MIIKFPSNVTHIPNHFKEPVYTCFAAACSRNITLGEELKTLVYKSNDGFYVAHLPGDRLLNMQSLQDYGFPESFCSVSELHKHNLQKGCLNPFNVFERLYPIKDTYICKTVLDIKRVYTNDGTSTGTIIFSPSLLVSLFNTIKVSHISMTWNKRNYTYSRRKIA